MKAGNNGSSFVFTHIYGLQKYCLLKKGKQIFIGWGTWLPNVVHTKLSSHYYSHIVVWMETSIYTTATGITKFTLRLSMWQVLIVYSWLGVFNITMSSKEGGSWGRDQVFLFGSPCTAGAWPFRYIPVKRPQNSIFFTKLAAIFPKYSRYVVVFRILGSRWR